MMHLRLATVVTVAVLAGCATETVPETGRERPPLKYTEEEEAILGDEAYRAILKDKKVITGTPEAKLVEEVGRKIARVTKRVLYRWEFKLIHDPKTVNAFCLPGGKVAVFSGLLPIAKDKDGLAVVLAHEVAHATLRHANERMSQPAWKRIVGAPVNLVVGLWGLIAPRTRKLVMSGLGLGYLVGHVMPYSQEHETEADVVGLRYMHAAGYDIDAAPAFWKRMQAEEPKGRAGVKDNLSTHPPSKDRAKRLRQEIQKIRAEEAKAGTKR